MRRTTHSFVLLILAIAASASPLLAGGTMPKHPNLSANKPSLQMATFTVPAGDSTHVSLPGGAAHPKLVITLPADKDPNPFLTEFADDDEALKAAEPALSTSAK